MIQPSKEEYLQMTGGERPMAIFRELLADMETPLGAYWKLAHDETFSFLLESVTGGEQLARFSILGTRPKKVLFTKGQEARTFDGFEWKLSRISEGRDPLHLIADEMVTAEPVPVPGMPTFTGGAVGLLGYDLVRFFEKLPQLADDDLEVPDVAMMFTDTVVLFDHAKNRMRIVAFADGTESSYVSAEAEIQRVSERLSGALPPLPSATDDPKPVTSNVTQEQFERMVERMKVYITQGDGIQMVPSQRFCTEVEVHPLTVYRALRSLNPSPYMFLVRFGDIDLVGASPEILVSLHEGSARVRPIAGTRWRGETPEEDRRLGEELLGDEKERAEHIMLVDLGRNDLGRVCDYGSVKVNELMVIERYSHVMHIVSDVTGRLRKDLTGFDLVRATFPAGTVSGAPKVRAMEIIEELEPTRRGAYAGSVGFFSHSGDLDMCIAIRTILFKDGKAYVQAGGGVVYDSIPSKEYDESCNKAKAALQAIAMAQAGALI